MKKSPYRAALAQTLAKASEVLGSRKAARDWVSSPVMGLNGARPIDLLRAEDGGRLVMEFLMRLEYGVFN